VADLQIKNNELTDYIKHRSKQQNELKLTLEDEIKRVKNQAEDSLKSSEKIIKE
jgi:hypothetical protein